MARIAALTFDLDGTLIDSAEGITHALNIALDASGLPPVQGHAVRGWIGDGPDALIRRALDALQRHDVDPLKLRRNFDVTTLHDPLAQGRPFDGIAELLAALAGRYPMAVVTNKPSALARAVLDGAGLLGWFSGVHGADVPAQRKPSPLLIQQAAARLGLAARSLLMVGDSAMDLHAAQAAGCHAAWVSWGYGSLPADCAATTLHSPGELNDFMHQRFKGDPPCPPQDEPHSRSSSSRSAAATPTPPAT